MIIWKRASSKETTENLTDDNRVFNFKDKIFEISKQDTKDKPTLFKNCGFEHRITSWYDSNTFRSELGNPLDLVLYYENGNLLMWEPFVEKICREQFNFDNIEEVKFGYIAGLMSPFGPFPQKEILASANEPGYVYWIEFKIKK